MSSCLWQYHTFRIFTIVSLFVFIGNMLHAYMSFFSFLSVAYVIIWWMFALTVFKSRYKYRSEKCASLFRSSAPCQPRKWSSRRVLRIIFSVARMQLVRASQLIFPSVNNYKLKINVCVGNMFFTLSLVINATTLS